MLYLSQRDDRWKNIKLGSCNVTIGSDGCKITVLGMLAEKYPNDVNNRFKGHYLSGCLVADATIPSVMPELEYKKGAYPCIAEVKVPVGQHFVVDLGNGYIVDPWTGKEIKNPYVKLNNRWYVPKGGTMADINWQERYDAEVVKNYKLTVDGRNKDARIAVLEAEVKAAKDERDAYKKQLENYECPKCPSIEESEVVKNWLVKLYEEIKAWIFKKR